MYAIIAYDRRDNTHTVLNTDIDSLSDAKELVLEHREDNINAFHISHDEYRKMFGNDPAIF